MNIEVYVVPPGGGEKNYSIPIAENAYYMPRVGEYINFREENGMSAFLILNVHHYFSKPRTKFLVDNIAIEAEPVILPEGIASPEHEKLCKSLNVTREYPDTVY